VAKPGPRIELTVRVDDLAPGGDGVAHAMIDGQNRAVFIPRVALGDEITVDVDLTSRPARGRVLRLLAPGRGRVAPPCTYVESCGACDWLHLTREAHREAREQQLRRGLPPAFRNVPVVFHDPTPALGYRTRGRLHVRASGGRAIVGMHGVGSHEVVEVSTCVVLHPTLDAAVAEVARLLEGAHGRGEARLSLGNAGKPVVDL
jgi:23S rRNA (uracil1939-C5)-methyltransferase